MSGLRICYDTYTVVSQNCSKTNPHTHTWDLHFNLEKFLILKMYEA